MNNAEIQRQWNASVANQKPGFPSQEETASAGDNDYRVVLSIPCPFCRSIDLEVEIDEMARWIRCKNCEATAPISLWENQPKAASAGTHIVATEAQTEPVWGGCNPAGDTLFAKRERELLDRISKLEAELEYQTANAEYYGRNMRYLADQLDLAGKGVPHQSPPRPPADWGDTQNSVTEKI